MQRAWIELLVMLTSAYALGQMPDSTTGACHKNVSFAVTEGGQPVSAVPTFTAKWIVNKRHQQALPGLCFSQTPDIKARNYVVVFSSSESEYGGIVPTLQTYVSTTSVSGSGMLQTLMQGFGTTLSPELPTRQPRQHWICSMLKHRHRCSHVPTARKAMSSLGMD